MTTKILTANRLDDGVVVFLDEDGSWTEDISKSKVTTGDEEGAKLEEQGQEAAKAEPVVDAYLIDVVLRIGQIIPVRYREKIRAYGPSTHVNFAKQDNIPEHFEHKDGVTPVHLNGLSG